MVLLNGPSGSGKLTLAEVLRRLIRAKRRERYEIVSIDDFLTMTAQDAIYEDDVYEISPDLCKTVSALLETAAGVILKFQSARLMSSGNSQFRSQCPFSSFFQMICAMPLGVITFPSHHVRWPMTGRTAARVNPGAVGRSPR